MKVLVAEDDDLPPPLAPLPGEEDAPVAGGMDRGAEVGVHPADPVEVVTVRAERVGTPLLSWSELPEVTSRGAAERPGRRVLTTAGQVEAAVFSRAGLGPGDEIVGPAIIEETDATTYLALGERAVVHDSGALEVEW